MFIAENISKRIGRKTLLDRCSLRLEPGTFTAVVGPNGAGKSTLLNILTGEKRGTAGRITLNGKPLKNYKNDELSRLRAILPQHTMVNFPFSVEQVVEIGRYPHQTDGTENARVVQEALHATGLQDFAERLYQTLSGGEQQRVQMARVMAQLHSRDTDTPKYALLDEPTASLDLAQQHGLLDLARQLCQKNIAVLAVLHDLNLALQYADRILFLKKGETIAYGTTAEIVNREIIERTFSHPVRLLRESGQTIIVPEVRREAVFI